ncbi:MAG TPA: glutamate racemase [Candidatus Saccharimonadales bacterium]|nr:glutamate racemase [Candidatus Saccharimonadales bacterium]
MKTIGVFDSGVGGLSVANAIEKAFPTDKVILKEDKANLPYGTKTPGELLELVLPILNKLSKQCDVIVVACNTVSTTIIDKLREEIKTPLIAMEPMVKPASEQTKSGVIAVCATPRTLASQRYKWLKDTYARNVKVVEPDCSDWTLMIENNQIEEKKISDRINKALGEGADVVVLGCTHYHWIEDLIKELVDDRAKVLQPEAPVIEQLKRVLGQLS